MHEALQPVEVTLIDKLTDATLDSATRLLRDLVAAGAALGWVDPPERTDVARMLTGVTARHAGGDAALAVATVGAQLVGLGFWERYPRPTHSRNADVQKVAVDQTWQGRGVGRRLMLTLITAAHDAQIEMLTLDLRGDNRAAIALYETLGFERYGRLERFVAVREARYDKLLYVLDLRR